MIDENKLESIDKNISSCAFLFRQIFMVKFQEHFPSRELCEGVRLHVTAIIHLEARCQVGVATPEKMGAEGRVN